MSTIIGKGKETYSGEKIKPSIEVLYETIVSLGKMPFIVTLGSDRVVCRIAPGAGGNIASMVAYGEADKNPKIIKER